MKNNDIVKPFTDKEADLLNSLNNLDLDKVSKGCRGFLFLACQRVCLGLFTISLEDSISENK